jgi:hypothetical protein
MFGFKKNKSAKKSVAQATDVTYKEISTQSSTPPAEPANQSDLAQTIQLLMNFAIGQLASGKTEDEVKQLITNQGANADVALLITNKAEEALAASQRPS